MKKSAVEKRSGVPEGEKWNRESVFPGGKEWEEETRRIEESIGGWPARKGTLSKGADVLASLLEARDDLVRRLEVVYMYAGMEFNVDTSDNRASAMLGRARVLHGKVMSALAWIEPELLSLGREKVAEWVAGEPRLSVYEHYFHNLFRSAPHVRSDEVEEILAALADPFSGPSNTASRLTSADFRFPAAVGEDGVERTLTQGTLDVILAGADREARRTAWENYMDRYVEHQNTLASNLETSVGQNVFLSRARRHGDTLSASLFENNIPVEVFHNLIETFRRSLPTWHRYWVVRTKALGVEKLHPYDIWAPLAKKKPVIPFERAVEWICEGIAPLGEEYVSAVRRGCFEERWVDRAPNEGKTAGAFSWGAHGTHPFIVMSYGDDMGALSTLAHELGHSMHSRLTWANQPPVYGDYSLFVAEVASNFHQAMVRAHLFETNDDVDFRISLIEEAMDNFHRYFFIMPTLALFEQEIHRIVEKGEGLTADGMIDLMTALLEEGYGGKVEIDRERSGMTWATFGHLYSDYYVYQYATGISGAHALSKRILAGEEGAAEDYLDFLSAGGSKYPLDALKEAGVDLTKPDAVEETFAVLAGMVEKLEELTAR